MIDPKSRIAAKHLLERLLEGEITTDQFNDEFPGNASDPALDAIYSNLWLYYSDEPGQFLRSDDLPIEAQKTFARCVAFLGTTLEYEWPAYRWISPRYGLLRLFGRAKQIDQAFENFKKHGEFAAWPFIKSSDMPENTVLHTD